MKIFYEHDFPLASRYFALQSESMKTDQAAEQLQTIRTLMERSALYRRALAPVMLFAGAFGVIAAIVGTWLHLDSIKPFGCLWLSTAIAVISGAFIIARRQALKENEAFWSAPTRRIAQALLPSLSAGMGMGLVLMQIAGTNGFTSLLTSLWVVFYGCALNSAGYFTLRGMKLFGWLFIAGGCGVLVFVSFVGSINSHHLMGIFFGGLHLAYGIYLYVTENRKNAA